jgi:hypothetical protein
MFSGRLYHFIHWEKSTSATAASASRIICRRSLPLKSFQQDHDQSNNQVAFDLFVRLQWRVHTTPPQ